MQAITGKHAVAFSASRVFGMLAVALGLMMAGVGPSLALVQINVAGGNVQPLPIALPDFAPAGTDPQVAKEMTSVISADLKRSGLFKPLDPTSFLENNLSVNSSPKFPDWQTIGAQALVTGSVSMQGDGRLKAEFRLWDTYAGQQMLGQQFFTTPENWRRLAHIIADAVYERLTGEKGYFDTRIAFVDESGPKKKRITRLAIMDQDGANVHYLTRGDNLVLAPVFSPNSQELVYMSYGGKEPSVYLLNIETGQREIVGNFPNMTFSPRFSPNGQDVIMSLQQGGNANIYVMDLRSRKTTRLTDSASIDTSPSYSPDAKQVVFESDRGGNQQLYVMNADGSNVHRISFGPGRYGTPVWSPRGDLIAFTKQYQGQFMIGVIKPDGSDERILTSGFHNEGPTWAPNGRVVLFFRDTPGANGGPQLWSVDLSGYNEQRVPTPEFASDPSWSPLID